MTLPLNKKQKQLVEKSMDLVPIMIRSMTRTAAYVTEEEQQELCQIGYLALCRSAVGFEEGRSFQPYAKTIIRHAIFDYWRKIARDRSMLCSLDEASSEDEHLHYRDLFSYEDTQTTHPEKDTNQTLLLEHLTQLGTGHSPTIQKELQPSICNSRDIPALTWQNTTKYQPIVYGHGKAKHGNYYSRMMHSMHF